MTFGERAEDAERAVGYRPTMMVPRAETPPEENDMSTQTKTTEPVVGDFATYGIGSDSYAVEIIAVSKSGITVTTRAAGVIQNGALPGDADLAGVREGTYTVVPDESGKTQTFRRNKRGDYIGVGGIGYLSIGRVRVYRDPSF